MRLLKTVLLSTTLLMSGVSASELSQVTVQQTSVNTTTEDYLAIVSSTNEFKKKVVNGLLKTITKFTGESAESLAEKGLTAESEVAPALGALLKMITGLTGERTEIASQLTAVISANEKLTSEKTKLEEGLVEASAKLDAVTKEKGDVDEKLVAAIANVAAFNEELKAARTAAEIADRKANEAIDKLTAELEAAQEEVKTLTAQAEELSAIKAKAEREEKEMRDGFATLNAAAAQQGILAALQPRTGTDVSSLGSRFESDDDFDDAPRGVGDEGSPQMSASPSETCADDSPISIRGLDGRNLAAAFAASEVDEATKVEIATLLSELTKAQTATTASPFSGKGSKKRNEDAQAAAITKVRDLTAQLKALGVDVEATAK